MYWVVGFGIPQTCTRWTIVMYWDLKTESTCVALVFEKYKSIVSRNVSVYMHLQLLHLSWNRDVFYANPKKPWSLVDPRRPGHRKTSSVQAGSASNCTACYDAHGRTLKDSECICPKGGMAKWWEKNWWDRECGMILEKKGLAKEDFVGKEVGIWMRKMFIFPWGGLWSVEAGWFKLFWNCNICQGEHNVRWFCVFFALGPLGRIYIIWYTCLGIFYHENPS